MILIVRHTCCARCETNNGGGTAEERIPAMARTCSPALPASGAVHPASNRRYSAVRTTFRKRRARGRVRAYSDAREFALIMALVRDQAVLVPNRPRVQRSAVPTFWRRFSRLVRSRTEKCYLLLASRRNRIPPPREREIRARRSIQQFGECCSSPSRNDCVAPTSTRSSNRQHRRPAVETRAITRSCSATLRKKRMPSTITRYAHLFRTLHGERRRTRTVPGERPSAGGTQCSRNRE